MDEKDCGFLGTGCSIEEHVQNAASSTVGKIIEDFTNQILGG